MSLTQKLADHYSEAGAEQVLVAIYDDEFVLYAQVTETTAKKIAEVVCMRRPFVQIEDAALSSDGLTYCWTFKRSKFFPSSGDWLPLVMTTVAPILQELCPELLDGGNVMYKDNRQLDANTIGSFASLLV
jgi:hypothetical protein